MIIEISYSIDKEYIIIICVFCLDLVLAFKLREGWRRDVGSPFVFYAFGGQL
jgi:hypothetical protein